jgi:ribosomal protein L40E
MTMPAEPENKNSVRSSRAVLCGKCEHLNPLGLETCERCGGHLFVFCRRCGTRNERVRTLCTKCHHSLHRAWWTPAWKVFERLQRLTWPQLLALIAGILVVLAIIKFMDGIRLPAL